MITISIHDSQDPGADQIYEGELLLLSIVSKTPKGHKADAVAVGSGSHEAFVACMCSSSEAVYSAIKDCESCRVLSARKCQEILVPEAAEFAKKMMSSMFGGNRNEN